MLTVTVLKLSLPPTWRMLQPNDRNGKFEDLTCKLARSQCSHAAVCIACKKINASSFLALTAFGLECHLPLIFWSKLTHPAGCST